MLFSTVFLVQTTLMLGYGQLHQNYGISQKACKAELWRIAQIIEDDHDSPLVNRAEEFSKRLVKLCYHDRIAVDSGLVGSGTVQGDRPDQDKP